jgi:hypothetical protein
MKVIEPLRLLSVTQRGRRLQLVVHDRARRRHIICLRVPTLEIAFSHVMVMTEWIRARTSLAYVRRGDGAALVDVDALFARAM